MRPGPRFAWLFCALASTTSAQTPRDSVTVSTITTPRSARWGPDTTNDLVFVVRDLHTPDRPLHESLVAVGKPGTDVRQHSMQRELTRADGTARFAGLGGMNIEAVVLMLGYEEVRFPLRLGRDCRQTVEVYLRSAAHLDDGYGAPPLQPRVVFTTCAPPLGYEPFHFTLGPRRSGPRGEEIWDATVLPPGSHDSLPPAFQLELSSEPGPANGANAHAVVRAGDRRGMSYFLGTLGGTFGPPPRGSSGALTPFKLEPADSISLTLSDVRRGPDGSWTALATLPNGGHFELWIDSGNRQGEFRSVGEAEDEKVLSALAGLVARFR